MSELGLVSLLILISLFTVVIKDYFKINKNHKFINNEFDSIMLKALFTNFLGTILIISSGSFLIIGSPILLDKYWFVLLDNL